MKCHSVQVKSSFFQSKLLFFLNNSKKNVFIILSNLEAGCTELQNRDNAVVKVSKNKLKMELLCDPGYVLASSPSAFCNGKNWDRKLGECRLDSELTEHCDFETHDTCGWTQDGDRDFDWVRRNGWNLSNKTNKYKLVSGPRHDHTVRYGFLFDKIHDIILCQLL